MPALSEKTDHEAAFDRHHKLQGAYDDAWEALKHGYDKDVDVYKQHLKEQKEQKMAELDEQHFGAVHREHRGW